MNSVDTTERQTDRTLDKASLGSTRFGITKGNLNRASGVMELSFDFKDFGERVELSFDTMGWRAKGNQCACQYDNKSVLVVDA